LRDENWTLNDENWILSDDNWRRMDEADELRRKIYEMEENMSSLQRALEDRAPPVPPRPTEWK
jgi:hypothetical protein